MSRIIRKYKDEDLQGVLDSWESATKIAHPFLTKEFLAQEYYNISHVYLPNTETWVAEQDSQVIGFVALIDGEDGANCEIGAIFVKPDFQGTGAGKALMDKAHDLHGDLEVEVFKANSIGRKFYDRYGFELMSESMHEPTGNELLRLKFSAIKSP